MNSFKQLFLTNLKIVYRNKPGFFWTVVMPSFIYISLSVLPIGKNMGDNLKYSNFVLPGIIAMTIMQGGIYGLAYWMTDLKSRGVISRFMVTPMKMPIMAISLVTSRLLVIIVQTLILSLIGIIFFNANFAGNYLSVIIFVMLGGSIFLLLGLLISGLASSYESAAPITSAIGLPLTFLGNIFYPIESLPHTLKILAKLLPITYLADGLRQSYLYAFDLQKIAYNILVLSIWLIIILLLTIKFFKLKE